MQGTEALAGVRCAPHVPAVRLHLQLREVLANRASESMKRRAQRDGTREVEKESGIAAFAAELQCVGRVFRSCIHTH